MSLEEALGLAGREGRGGLVEDDDAGVHGEGLGDLHQLPFARRQALHLDVRRDVQVHRWPGTPGHAVRISPRLEQGHLPMVREAR